MFSEYTGTPLRWLEKQSTVLTEYQEGKTVLGESATTLKHLKFKDIVQNIVFVFFYLALLFLINNSAFLYNICEDSGTCVLTSLSSLTFSAMYRTHICDMGASGKASLCNV